MYPSFFKNYAISEFKFYCKEIYIVFYDKDNSHYNDLTAFAKELRDAILDEWDLEEIYPNDFELNVYDINICPRLELTIKYRRKV